jgi:hypothetical protein
MNPSSAVSMTDDHEALPAFLAPEFARQARDSVMLLGTNASH